MIKNLKIKLIISMILSLNIIGCNQNTETNTTNNNKSSEIATSSKQSKDSSFQLGLLPESEWKKSFELTDHNGKIRHLDDFKGKVVAIFFGYTHCPDVCPSTLGLFRETINGLSPEEAKKFQALFVTVDPERDTPELLKQFVPAFHDSFLGLYTTPEKTKILTKNYRVFFEKVATSNKNYYNINHSTTGYLFDPQGNMKLFFDTSSNPEVLIHDVKLLLK